MKYMTNSGVEEFILVGVGESAAQTVAANFVDILKDRIDKIKESDLVVNEIVKKERKKRKKVIKKVDSDLSGFLD